MGARWKWRAPPSCWVWRGVLLLFVAVTNRTRFSGGSRIWVTGGGGGGGFRLKPHMEVRFKWMWRDGGCLSKRKERQNGVWVSLPACAYIMVTRARSGCGANKKMAHDQLARVRPSSCRRSTTCTSTRWRFRSALGQVFFCGDHCVSRRERSLIC